MDVAELGFAIDTESLKEANKQLDELPKKARRVKTQYDIMGDAADAAAKSAQANAKATAASLKEVESAAKVAATATQKAAATAATASRRRTQYDIPGAGVAWADVDRVVDTTKAVSTATELLAIQQGEAATRMAATAQAAARLGVGLVPVAEATKRVTDENEKLKKSFANRALGQFANGIGDAAAAVASMRIVQVTFATAAASLFVGAVVGIYNYLEGTQKAASEMIKLAQAHNLTTDQVQTLQAEAKRTGQTFDQLVASFGKNKLGLDTLTQAFLATGRAIDTEVIAKVAEMERRTKEATDKMHTHLDRLRSVIASIYIQRKAEFLESAAQYLDQIARAVNSMDIRKLLLLTSPITAGNAASVLKSEDEAIARGEGVKKAQEYVDKMQAIVDKKKEAEKSAVGSAQAAVARFLGYDSSGAEKELEKAKKALDAAKELQDKTREALGIGRSQGYAGPDPVWMDVPADTTKKIESVGTAAKESTAQLDAHVAAQQRHMDSYQSIMQSGREYIEQQRMEGAALFATTYETERLRAEYELLQQVRRAGLILSDEEIAKLQALAAEMAKTKVETDEQKKLVADAKEVYKGFFADLRSGLRDGASLWESLGNAAANALNRIADKLMELALNSAWDMIASKGGGGGGGGLGSLISSGISFLSGAFSGGFGGASSLVGTGTGITYADGGNYMANRPRIVGENGIEFDFPRTSGTILNMEQMAGLMGGGDQVVINQTLNFGSDVTRSSMAAWARIIKEETKREALAAMMDNRARGGKSKQVFSGAAR